MDIYKKGSDSMMGRYFPYRMHPFSVAELLDVSLPGNYLVRKVSELPNEDWDALLKFGGFPDPFLNRDARFSRRWNSLRFEQLMRTDARDISRVSEIDQMALLAELLSNRSGEQLVYKNLGREIGIDEKTAKAWVKTLKNLYFGFEVRPWFVNIENSIRKTPKWYLRDWAGVKDDGKRAETLIACHLLKAVEGWTDLGYGEFSLGYLRDKTKREVDFIVARDGVPWFLVEVKKSKEAISDSLGFFQKRTKAKHAFQVVIDAEYVDRDCFEYDSPIAVPAKTFLSQLL
jgi:predicted AAA+ superfamily ATPase